MQMLWNKEILWWWFHLFGVESTQIKHGNSCFLKALWHLLLAVMMWPFSCHFDSLIGWRLFPPILTLTESSCDINQVDLLLCYLRGHPHGNASVCVNAHVLLRFGRSSTWILKKQRLKTRFFETGSQGGKIWKRSPHVVMWTANLHTL